MRRVRRFCRGQIAMVAKIKVNSGDVFGKLEVIYECEGLGRRFLFLCDCGNYTETSLESVRSGHTKSCGCIKGGKVIHSYFGEKSYAVWSNAKDRCYNKNCIRYHRYGGRAIKMYSKWINNPVAFCRYVESLVGFGYPGLSLDRIDNDKGYIPGNLRYATATEQANNRGKKYV